ncbi:MAG: hypothetical protein R8K22_09030 [Mariprofundaceae bacterium]
MKVSQASIAGGMIGVLAAIVICTVRDVGLSDTVYRTLILGGAGAWMGMLLAWLNRLLIPKSPVEMPQNDPGKDQPENRA